MLEKKWEYNGTVHPLFIDFKNVYDSVEREVLYNILTEFGIFEIGIIEISKDISVLAAHYRPSK